MLKCIAGRAFLAANLALTACAGAHNVWSVSASPQPPANASLTAVGSQAPAFSALALDGTPVTLDAYRGKTLVLNFWATWCPPCRAETPDMIRAFGTLKADDVAFLGIDTTETAPIVKSFVALEALPYPVALADPETYNAYGIAYIPTTIVIDPSGIVRARWTGAVTPGQLASYVASARAGKNAIYVTAEQRKIDGLLTLRHFSIAAAQARLKTVNDYLDELNKGSTLRYDTARTELESGTLELQTGRAMQMQGKTPKARIAALELQAQGYGDLNRYADAVRVHGSALALAPNDPKIIGALTRAYYRLHDYAAMAAMAVTWTKLAPKDADAWDQLGLANQRQQKFAAAIPAYERALALLIADAKKEPVGADGDAVTSVADESLDFANVYVALGDAKNAQAAFAQAQRYAAMIPPKGANAAMIARVGERTLEGLSGASIARGAGTHLALAPWVGANLPGSAESTFRYRLVTVAPAGATVTLGTKGLKRDWIASFCQDRLCSPNAVTFTMPADGVKTYEFQLVPPGPGLKPGRVSIGAADSNWVSTPAV
jgi:peroxiredoxin/tetratricopeptide (TPR) repeat protein